MQKILPCKVGKITILITSLIIFLYVNGLHQFTFNISGLQFFCLIISIVILALFLGDKIKYIKEQCCKFMKDFLWIIFLDFVFLILYIYRLLKLIKDVCIYNYVILDEYIGAIIYNIITFLLILVVGQFFLFLLQLPGKKNGK